MKYGMGKCEKMYKEKTSRRTKGIALGQQKIISNLHGKEYYLCWYSES